MISTKEFRKMYIEAERNFNGTEEERREMQIKMYKEWYDGAKVGEHMHIKHWTDVTPCTIVKRTKSTITVRMDKAQRDPNYKPEWIVGGFSAVCTNDDEQKWIIEEDDNGYTETFRWHKNDNAFVNNCGERLFPGWLKYYDYNF